ncbi:hypothetical protein SRHO_G00088130 [Serrasalmus rhombeus]
MTLDKNFSGGEWVKRLSLGLGVFPSGQWQHDCNILKLANLQAHGAEPPMVSELDKAMKPHAPGEKDTEPGEQQESSAPEPLPKGQTPRVSQWFERSMVGRVLQNFQEFYTSAQPSIKDRESAWL